MKPSAYLINAARGGVVDEQALYQALKDGKLAGAALDVYANEPPDLGMGVFDLENVILTPHSAAMTDMALVNMAIDASKGILEVLDGRIPGCLVNKEVLKVGAKITSHFQRPPSQLSGVVKHGIA